MADLDRPAAVRNDLDAAALADWLRKTLDVDDTPEIRQYPSGFSNLTYRLDLPGRRLVLRRPPPGADVKGGHDMGREVRLLRALHGRVPVPQALAYEPDPDVLGAPFYVMEHVEGVILRAGAEPEPPDTMARVADAFVSTLADLHAVDVEAVGLGEMGQPEGYVERQVEGWSRRYQRAATDTISDLEGAFAWMRQHQPAESGAALIHNDAKYDNLVFDPDLREVRAVLDWELATVGDPLMDLGSTLGYWVEATDPPALRAAALSPTWWPGNPTRQGLVDAYRQRTGRDPGDAVFYTVYGLVKLAVIAQQIYKRWKEGHASDPRFEALIEVVRACGRQAAAVIERGRISDLNR